MSKKLALLWDEWNKEHIQKHQVTPEEVEEAYKNQIKSVIGYENRLLILGKTKKERLLTVVISFEKQKRPYVVSARDTSRKERRLLNENTETH